MIAQGSKNVWKLLSNAKVQMKFSTINPKQMQQFDTIKGWWHPSSEMNVLFQYNYQRIDFLKAVLQKTKSDTEQTQSNFLKPLQNKNIIDVGCGAGFLSESMTRLGGNVIGLDPNPTSYNEATTHKSQKSTLQNLKYFNVSIQQYLEENPEQIESKDIITSMDVIQHVDNPQLFISQLVKALKPSGHIMISTISKNIGSFFSHIVVAEYLTGMVPRGTHHYEKFISPPQLRSMLEREGVQVKGIRELEYTLKGNFQQRKNGANYIMIGQKRAAESK